MNLVEFNQCQELVGRLRTAQEKLEYAGHRLGVTLNGTYQDDNVLDAVRPVVVALIESEIDRIKARLAEYGVTAP